MGRNKTISDADVLSIARGVFQKLGHAASTRDIANEVGISQAVLFQRFGSKDELFFRAMVPETPDLEALLGAYSADDTFEHLLTIAERLAAYLREFMPTFLKVLAFPGAGSERLRQWHAQLPFYPIVGALAERLRKLAADGLVEKSNHQAHAVAFMMLVHCTVLFQLLTDQQDHVRRRVTPRSLLQILWRGLEPRDPAPARKKR